MEEDKSAILQLDPCANRMHDITGSLLLYYFEKQKLPDTLDDLKALPNSDLPPELSCPVSHKPYVYDPVGFYDIFNHTRVVLYDAAPDHSGYRWAIQLQEPQDNSKGLVAKVVLLPESFFKTRPPK